MTLCRRIGGSLALTASASVLFWTLASTDWTSPLAARTARATVAPGSFQFWADGDVPTVPDTGPDKPVELGVSWTSDDPGTVTALRFYKSVRNTGEHVGHLWTETGELVGSAKFVDETASGWQTARLSEPVRIVPGRVYVASYHTKGHYSADAGYFETARVRGPLHASANRVRANGVFRYGPAGTFPAQTYKASNYWVDIVFERERDRTPPRVTSVAPAPGATEVTRSTTVQITFSEPVDTATLAPATVSIRPDRPGARPISARIAYDSAGQVVTLTPASPLAQATLYRVTVKGRATRTPGTGGGPAGTTPDESSDVDSGVPDGCPCELFGSAVPAVLDSGSGEPVELGMHWRSDIDGVITSLRFYKAPGDQGPHEGHLWTVDGRLLGTARFLNETASGWQRAPLTSEVPVSADTTYVVSYYSKTGHYAYDPGYFTAPRSRGPLRAPGAPATNGVFSYGPPGKFPSKSYNATNYWVDVVFEVEQDTESSVSGATPPASAPRDPAPVLRVTDIAGNGVTSDYSTTFVTARSVDTCPCTLFGSALPRTFDAGSDVPAELGVRFTTSVDGFITGLRFYKSASNAGPHAAHLWAADGALLAAAPFADETPSGWQETSFAAPVAIRANTPYTASYSAPSGHYSVTADEFTKPVSAGPLRAAADGDGGANGVIRHGPGGMPTVSRYASNYWVDVVFVRQPR